MRPAPALAACLALTLLAAPGAAALPAGCGYLLPGPSGSEVSCTVRGATVSVGLLRDCDGSGGPDYLFQVGLGPAC